jgi:2-polyprenyl-6-methoxyphenol hydroxylase-like FAD-dependent oxidoreductase
MTLDALVVGAGPVGLSMAAELSRYGLSCRIVDVNEGPSIWSKAQIIHARTLEVFDDMGVVEPILAEGRKISGASFFDVGEDARRIGSFTIGEIDSHYPYLLSLSQRQTEQQLAAHLERAYGLRIERKVRLERFTQDAEGVTAHLTRDDGSAEELRAAWLIGCDGAHSTVRKTLGLPFEGMTYPVRLVQADVRVDMTTPLHDDEFDIFFGPRGLLALFPMPEPKRYRMISFLEPENEEEVKLELFQRLMAERGPAGATVSDPAWMIDFRIHCRLASRYRLGRVFLAGDAAHIHSPAGGQGMNMGIQDAYNLAWKLALVQKKLGKEVLLDAYEAERRPVAEATLRGTDTMTRAGLGMIALMKNPIAHALRNQLFGFVTSLGFVQTRATRGISMIEVGYPKSPIVAQDQVSLFSVRVLGGDDERPSMAEWLQFGEGPAPGQRTPDVVFPEVEGGAARLHELLRGTHHTLLLFDGAAKTEEGYTRLGQIASAVAARCGELVKTHVVVLPPCERPPGLPESTGLLRDRDGELHRRFGARAECLYLIRPDGYVGYRCQPADEHRLAAYLDRLFV